MEACYHGHTEIVYSLFTETDVNTVDLNNSTALMLAIEKYHYEIVNALLEIPHVEINVQNAFGGD